ncbi:MAG: tetratricopeptide repeat protein [Bacteroidales bacterium]|nr:tetratricopeptide repeat protein [Bacteroidales bacterium]
MATKQNEIQGNERMENVEEALGKTELWVENNQRVLWIILGIVIVIALAIFGLTKRNQMRNEAASSAIFKAQNYFESEQYENALNGDGNNLGFLDIIDEYGSTKTGKLASYYAGISYMKTGKYQEAIDYLKKFDGKDEILAPMALGAIGDCYMELDDMSNAVSYYKQAAGMNANEFTSPMFLQKAGMTYEIMGDDAKALETYKTLQKDFPLSNEAFDITKKIAYLEAKMK